MSSLDLVGINKSFGQVAAVRDVHLSIEEGQFVSFLGPSGCGKTTLLRLIAGLEAPTSGLIKLGGADISALPTHRRGIGMVFQSLALFPHLTVGENISYGLRLQGVNKADCRAKSEELLDLVRLPGVADRRITQLSGGQRQRVAIARALALQPKLFLLDEPLSALDAKLREEMQVELKLLQKRLNITTIIVTHDQREAMTMSDRIVVMSTSRIQQVGTPLDIYRKPANAFVAEFIGAGNRLPVSRINESTVRFGQIDIAVDNLPASPEAQQILVIRPEDLNIAKRGPSRPNTLDATVLFIRDLGSSVEFHLRADNQTLIATTTPKARPDLQPGDAATLHLPREACWVVSA